MPAALLNDLVHLLLSLERTQGELLELHSEKSAALRAFEGRKLVQLSEREGELVRRLQTVLAQRNRLLERARLAGVLVDSLLQLAGAIGSQHRVVLEERIRQAQGRAVQLRQQSWVHWIVSHRCYNHYTELLDLIAHRGEPAPTYGENPNLAPSGGAILDAAA